MPILPIECSIQKGANIIFRLKTKLLKLRPVVTSDYKKFPIIINNYNRLDYLLKLIKWLEGAGMTNIFIIDNNSDYQPLLNYYRRTPYTVFKLDKNKGHLALWETIIFTRFSSQYYVYTDPDILPVEECPLNTVQHFYNMLQQYPQASKVGFGLKIDDLPEGYLLRDKVIRWEKQFWKKEVEHEVYDALIDTTFALYRPGAKGGASITALRTGGRYTARHLPWYEDPKSLSAESRYYYKSASNASSWYAALKGEETPY